MGGQKVELHCIRSDGVLKLEMTTYTDNDGKYVFVDIVPGTCRVKVILDDPNYEFTAGGGNGGNQIGKDGWSDEIVLQYDGVAIVSTSVYMPTPKASCDPLRCANKEIDPVLGYHDCGWGIFNDCTCQVRAIFLLITR